MADQINAKQYNMWDLMSGEFVFHIPEYQRPYSWTENEAVTLWDDLVEFWQNATSATNYFAGSIVLVKDGETPESEVIDGQQRLSTLSLILAVMSHYSSGLKKDIRKCLWEEGIQHKKIAGKSRLTLRKRDAHFFEQYVSNGKPDDMLDLDPKQLADDAQRLLQSNGRELIHRAHELFDGRADLADSFITALFNQCFFVVVTTSDNESAFRVFSVMNNRGLSLLPSDIIKAHVIGDIDESQREYYTEKWDDTEADLGREAFNSLLSHIRMVYCKNKLHGTLVSEFESTVFRNCNSLQEFIADVLVPFAQVFRSITHCSYTASSGAEDVNESLSWLNRVDDSDWVPPMMCALAGSGQDSGFIAEFSAGLERVASFFYLASKTTNQRIERYARVISALQAGDKAGTLDLLRLSPEERSDFISVLDGDIYLMPARKRTYIVQRLDRMVSDKAVIYKNAVFSIEHVLPQNPKEGSKWLKEWSDDKAREYWLHKIANLIPLTGKKNSQAQNYDFEEKKKKYFCGKNGITSYALAVSVIGEKSWTPETVEARQHRLIAVMSMNWQLTDIIPSTPTPEVNTAELVRQERLLKELDIWFAANPGTLLPRIYNSNEKVGEFVHNSMHQLSISGFKIAPSAIERLCGVDASRKYTRRKLPFLVRTDAADLKSPMMKRYWRTASYTETFNGVEYYIYSQWYPDQKLSGDAHKSDFLQFYLDLARGQI